MLKYRGHVIPVKDSGSSSKAVAGGGGEGQGWSSSRVPYPYVSLSPDSPPLARETRHWHDWHSRHTRHVNICYAISFVTYDVSDLERFPIWPEVTLFFFWSRVRIFVFWLFSHIKFCFKPRRTSNGSCWVRFFDRMISSNKLFSANFFPGSEFPRFRYPGFRTWREWCHWAKCP